MPHLAVLRADSSPHSGITPGGLRGQYEVPEFEPGQSCA